MDEKNNVGWISFINWNLFIMDEKWIYVDKIHPQQC
jgi:hypothetical protein